ncbi:MAG: Mfa1 fimbrilin C-terminal domain-containing protein [Bacteroidales bacterium]|nr:Mfa1 fimbrilin C-terminal domain-containing protein [Bacteroidales bacterium]
MKLIKITMVSLAAALVALTACNKGVVAPENGNGNEDATLSSNYLSVNIVPAPVTTRAAAAGADPDGAEYEAGTADENAVSAVRFYFFKEDGTPFLFKNGGTDDVNYYDWTTPDEGDTPTSPSVEKLLTATIVLKTNPNEITKEKYPKQMVAVLNPDFAGIPAGNASLADLQEIVKDFRDSTNTKNSFAMFNSSYADAGIANIITAVEVKAENVCAEPSAALANPVDIYVERCVAKVRVDVTATKESTGFIKLKDKDGNDLIVNDGNADVQIYLKLGKWDVTSETKAGYLSKVIDTWPIDLFGSGATTYNKWNWAPYHRSFWALNPQNAGHEYYSYNYSSRNGYELGTGVAYTNENAGDGPRGEEEFERKWPTQVIILGQLVNQRGGTLEICEFAGERFLGENALLTKMANFLHLYKVTISQQGTTTITTYTKVTPADLKLVTAYQHDVTPLDAGQDNPGHYYVQVRLKDGYAANTYATSNAEGTPYATKAEVDAALAEVGHAKIWSTGMTYYFFPINHLGAKDNPGYCGVVRNHIYDCKISNIAGLGTPVYDPDETIWPEKPEDDDDVFIAAQVEVISWRVVSNEIQLEW